MRGTRLPPQPACMLSRQLVASLVHAPPHRLRQCRLPLQELEAQVHDAGKVREELARVQRELGALHGTASALRSQLRQAREAREEAASARERMLAAQVGEGRRHVGQPCLATAARMAGMHAIRVLPTCMLRMTCAWQTCRQQASPGVKQFWCFAAKDEAPRPRGPVACYCLHCIQLPRAWLHGCMAATVCCYPCRLRWLSLSAPCGSAMRRWRHSTAPPSR